LGRRALRRGEGRGGRDGSDESSHENHSFHLVPPDPGTDYTEPRGYRGGRARVDESARAAVGRWGGSGRWGEQQSLRTSSDRFASVGLRGKRFPHLPDAPASPTSLHPRGRGGVVI